MPSAKRPRRGGVASRIKPGLMDKIMKQGDVYRVGYGVAPAKDAYENDAQYKTGLKGIRVEVISEETGQAILKSKGDKHLDGFTLAKDVRARLKGCPLGNFTRGIPLVYTTSGTYSSGWLEPRKGKPAKSPFLVKYAPEGGDCKANSAKFAHRFWGFFSQATICWAEDAPASPFLDSVGRAGKLVLYGPYHSFPKPVSWGVDEITSKSPVNSGYGQYFRIPVMSQAAKCPYRKALKKPLCLLADKLAPQIKPQLMTDEVVSKAGSEEGAKEGTMFAESLAGTENEALFRIVVSLSGFGAFVDSAVSFRNSSSPAAE